MAKIKSAKTLIFGLILVSLFSFRLWQTTGCRQFTGFYFNPVSILIAVESNVLEDNNSPRIVSRLFHNKISTGTFEITKSYVAALDVRFLISFLGPLGLSLVLISITKIARSKNFLSKTSLVLPLSSSFLLISSINPKISFYAVAFSWYLFSLQGIGLFTKSNLLRILFILLVPITFWYFSFNWQMPQICNKIFFN